MVLGLDKADKSVRWQTLLAVDPATVREGAAKKRVASLCGDRFLGSYGVGDRGWRITAIDATSGARQWDIPITSPTADSFSGIYCSATRAGSLAPARADC